MTLAAAHHQRHSFSTAIKANTHAVPLHQLPEGLAFPDSLVDHIWFDADRKQLVFRGFMSKYAFDCLHALHSDRHYQRAIDELFRICVYEEPVPPKRWKLAIVAMAAIAGVLVVAGSSVFLLTRSS